MKGYLFIRNHTYFDEFDLCLLGITDSISKKDADYAWKEIVRGWFGTVFEVLLDELSNIKKLVKEQFQHLNYKGDGGVDFYNKKLIELIEPFLVSAKIDHKRLTNEDIHLLLRPVRVKETMKKIKFSSLIKTLKSTKPIATYKKMNFIFLKNILI